MRVRFVARTAKIVVCLVLAPSLAFADAIDGDWCSPSDARHFRIVGTSITTPAGTQTSGDYSRHAFSYAVPVGEADAGKRIDMQLLNEDEVRVAVSGQPPEIWRRCDLNA